MEVAVDSADGLIFGKPRKLFRLPEHPFDGGPMGSTPFFEVTGDGQRFLIARPSGDGDEPTRGIVVVQNWVSEHGGR